MKKIELKDFQDKFIFSKKRFPAFIAGWGTGKTMSLLLKVWNYCENNENSLWWIIRKEYQDLKDSTCQDFEKMFDVTIPSSREYEFPNGSKIGFRHGGEVTKNNLSNVNLSGAGIEQAEEFETDEEFQLLRGRIRRDDMPYHQIAIIGNTNGHNWIWKRWKANRPSKQYVLSQATTFDNADVLPDDFINDLKNMKEEAPNQFKQYVMNSWEVSDDADIIIPYEWVSRAIRNEYPTEAVKKVVFADVAEGKGRDETVIYGLENEKIIDADISRQNDPIETAGRIIKMKRRIGANLVGCDAIGIGAGTYYELNEMLDNVYGFKSSHKANDKERFRNRKAEAWWHARNKFKNAEVAIPDDDKLISQLSGVEYKVSRKGQIQLVKKKDIVEKLGCSPDRADAYVGGLWLLKQTKPIDPGRFRTQTNTAGSYSVPTAF